MIVVTGATGPYGRQIVEHLLDLGVPAAGIAAAVRTPARAAGLAARGVALRTADYDRPGTLRTALAGATKVLLVSSTGPDEVRVAQHRAVIDAAGEAGVDLLAYTSVTGAPANPMGLARVHRATEAALAASGLPVALLRNGWYTENHTGTLRDAVGRGVLAGSAGTGRIAFASRAELAEAAARVLTLGGQAGTVHDLTGDTARTLAEAAAQTGTPVAYQDLPPEAYRRLLTRAGLPAPAVELIVDSDRCIAQGALEHPTGDLRALLGRPTETLAAAVTRALKE
ncbi:NAD(P)H-binding protein [Streptomyces albidoflavus]